MRVSIFLLFTLIWILFIPTFLQAKVNVLENFQSGKRILKISMPIPQDFIPSYEDSDEKLLNLCAPFSQSGNLIDTERYIAEQFPFTSIITITRYQKFDPDQIIFDQSDLAKNSIVFVDKKNKYHGAKGLIFTFKQFAQGRWFRKWFAVFGNDYQTSIIAVIFPEHKLHTHGEILHKTLLHADLVNP